MLGVRVSPDIHLAPRASSISYSTNSAETRSVSRSMLSVPISTSLPAKVSPVNHKSASSIVGLDKTASLPSSNIVDLSRGPANLANDAKAQFVDVFTVSPLIELINEQIPSSSDSTSELSTESAPAPVELPTSTLSFGSERIAKHYAANAFIEDVSPKTGSLYQSI